MWFIWNHKNCTLLLVNSQRAETNKIQSIINLNNLFLCKVSHSSWNTFPSHSQRLYAQIKEQPEGTCILHMIRTSLENRLGTNSSWTGFPAKGHAENILHFFSAGANGKNWGTPLFIVQWSLWKPFSLIQMMPENGFLLPDHIFCLDLSAFGLSSGTF